MNPAHLDILERFAWGGGVSQDELAEAFGLDPVELSLVLPTLVGPRVFGATTGEGCQRVGEGSFVEADPARPHRFLNALWQVVLNIHPGVPAPDVTALLGCAHEVANAHRALSKVEGL